MFVRRPAFGPFIHEQNEFVDSCDDISDWRGTLVFEKEERYKVNFSAYIDGFNLYKGALTSNPNLKWFDLSTYVQRKLPELEMSEIFYFTAHLRKRFPTDLANERQHKYLRVLSDSGVQIVSGKFDVRPTWKPIFNHLKAHFTDPELPSQFGITQRSINRIWQTSKPNSPQAQILQFREKGSDVNLASYMLRDVYKRGLRNLLVITGDSDLITPIRMAEEEGVNVLVIIPTIGRNNMFNKFSKIFSNVELISLEEVSDCQFRNPYKMRSGTEILKPAEWET
jgi:uncharacterized LabA/DUF88 family protein